MTKLQTMTQARWDAMTPAQKDTARDMSGLCPQLIGLEGKRVRVFPSPKYGPATFLVGRSTGWRPCHLAMRGNAHGSSNTLGPNDKFDKVTLL